MRVVYGEEDALSAIMQGENVFISGPGGSGKSRMISGLREMFADTTLFCAPTGVAALNIKGMTTHRSFGLTFGVTTAEDYKARSKKQAILLSSKALDSLVIDEGPMVRLDKFIEMDMKLRHHRKSSEPFAGLQVIIFGDGFQCKPVLTQKEEAVYRQMYGSELIFDSELWKALDFTCAYLPKVYRQQDPEFTKSLNDIRVGRNIPQAVEWFNTHCYGKPQLAEAVTLATTNKIADEINKREFKKVPTPASLFKAVITGDFPDRPVPEDLELKVGLKVMVTVNDLANERPAYVNGTVGVIRSIATTFVQLDIDGAIVDLPKNVWKNVIQVPEVVYRTKTSEVTNPDGTVTEKKERVEETVLIDTEVGTYTQFPLKLGYAITGHKAQGLTLDAVNIDMGYGAFAAGQSYVMLSRAKDAQKLRLTKKLRAKDIIVDSAVVDFYERTFPEVFKPGGKYAI